MVIVSHDIKIIAKCRLCIFVGKNSWWGKDGWLVLGQKGFQTISFSFGSCIYLSIFLYT